MYDRSASSTILDAEVESDSVDTPKTLTTSEPDVTKLVESNFLESKERRLLEMRLMVKFVTKTEETLFIDDLMRPPAGILSTLAFESDAFLYTCLCLTAQHSSRTGPDKMQRDFDKELYMGYLSMAIREHQKVITQCNLKNIEALTWTAGHLRMCAFAALEGRHRNPYSPPIEWLRSGRVGALYRQWCEQTKHAAGTTLVKMYRNHLSAQIEIERFKSSHQHTFEYVLDRLADLEILNEPWETDTQEAYGTALGYIGSIQEAGERGGGHNHLLRKLIIFPMMITKHFCILVESCQPRALVVLAHYFALLDAYGRQFWWIGNGAAEEVYAIAEYLDGTPWEYMLRWPIEFVEKLRNEG